MRVILSVFISGMFCPAIHAQQQTGASDNRLSSVATRMSDENMSTRHAGFDELIKEISIGQRLGFDPEYSEALSTFLSRHPSQAESIKMALIRLLQADDDAFVGANRVRRTYTEDDTEHWAAAIQLVSGLKDERAIPALVDALTTGGMAGAGVIQFGTKALGAVLSKLDSPDPLVRSSAVGAAITILRQENDPESRDQAFGLIGAAIRDQEFLLRSAAISQIDNLSADKRFSAGLRAFVPALEEIAKSDPFIVPGDSVYPLRARAKVLLAKFR